MSAVFSYLFFVFGLSQLTLIVQNYWQFSSQVGNIFWIQNIGLWLFPLLIGKVLDNTNPQVVNDLKNHVITPEQAAVSYNYTWPLVMLACLGVAALIIGIILKRVDKVKGLGLELPNVQQ